MSFWPAGTFLVRGLLFLMMPFGFCAGDGVADIGEFREGLTLLSVALEVISVLTLSATTLVGLK